MRSTLRHSARIESVERRVLFNGGDVDPPIVTAIAFDFDTPATKPSITVNFSEPVQPTTFDGSANSSFTIVDRATNLPVAPGNFAVNNTTASATIITFKGGVGAPADGDFRITVNAGNVRDLAGNVMTNGLSLNYFFLLCDATRDRKVDTQDFNQLAGNFGDGGRKFSQGDFSFDGNINSIDFLFLRSAGYFGRKLPAVPAGSTLFAPFGNIEGAADLFA